MNISGEDFVDGNLTLMLGVRPPSHQPLLLAFILLLLGHANANCCHYCSVLGDLDAHFAVSDQQGRCERKLQERSSEVGM